MNRVNTTRTLVVLLAATVPLAAQDTPVRIDRVAWLTGCWERPTQSGSMLEVWSPPRGGALIGGSLTVRGGVASAWEYLRIFERDGGLVYLAIPSGQVEAEFPGTTMTDSLVVFENPTHDFPTSLTYRRQGPDQLLAEVRGPGPNGPRGFDQTFRRVSCQPD